MKSKDLVRRVRLACWSIVAVAAAGCGEPPLTLTCDPACPPGMHCTTDGCVADSPIGGVDAAVPSDMAITCAGSCSGATPYCNALGVCVPCVEDKHCPQGSYCRVAGVTSVCVPGCNDDARCGSGGMKCCSNQCVDTTKDARNCGGCGTACMVPNAGAACMNGQCTAGACRAGWGDCNQNGADGCETSLRSDVKNCTACGMSCSIAHAVAGCADGCYLAACNYGYEDCNADEKDGCEVATLADIKNCGECGKGCQQVSRAQIQCNVGNCVLAGCNVGFADCNGIYNDGCETGIAIDIRNCGKCGNQCAQGQVCVNGECTCPVCNFPNAKAGCFGNMCGIAACNPGWANCDNSTPNGCEQNIDSDSNNCGGCGVKCAQGLVCVQQSCTCPQCKIPNAKSVCINNVCVLDSCLPGFANCNGQQQDGCEADLNSDANNCSACGKVCGANMACSLGACTMCGNQLINNGSILCVPQGMNLTLGGDLCYASQIIINGTLNVQANDGNTGGTLVLRSPSIVLGATGRIVGDTAGSLGGKPSAANGGMQGGGAGGGCGGGPGSSVGQGGSGGGYGGAGGTCKVPTQWTAPCDKCSQATIAHCYGAVGAVQGTSNGSDYDMGGGGGAGGNSSGCANAGGRGGNGGAAIVLLAKSVQLDGLITSAGEAPPQDPNNCGYHPGGGGGSGGAVVVRAGTLTGKGTLLATGGAGGYSPGQANDWGWAGGGGGGGRVKVFATSDNFNGMMDTPSGVGGGACMMTYCYVGMPGMPGSTFRSNSIPNNWNLINCGGL